MLVNQVLISLEMKIILSKQSNNIIPIIIYLLIGSIDLWQDKKF